MAMPRFSFLLRLPVLLFVVHVYVAWRLASGFSENSWRLLAIGVLLGTYAVMMAGFLVRDRVGMRASDAVSWAGFLALGLFSWIFVLTVLRDVALLLSGALRLAPSFRDAAWLVSFPEVSAIAVLAASLVASLAGFVNARRQPAIVNVDIPIRDLPPALDGFRIVQVTDLHVGPTIKHGFVHRVVTACNRLDADMIALTGDLVDGSVQRLARHTRALSMLRARHGTYVVTGNHEYYVGAEPWIAEFERLGMTVLLNEHRLVEHRDVDAGTGSVLVAGVTDFGAGKFISSHASDPVAAIRGAADDADVKILLAHQPRSMFAAAPLGFDLQLSGHTHGGQYWPWNYFVPLQQPLVAGLHRHQGMQVYVSRGTGYWGPPLRLGARSEITLVRLRRAEP